MLTRSAEPVACTDPDELAWASSEAVFTAPRIDPEDEARKARLGS